MSAANSIKFLCLFALCFSACSSCGWRTAQNENMASVDSSAEAIKSGVPFSTKEPENFQADFVIRMNNDSETKIFVARSGVRRRYDYNLDRKNQFAVLHVHANASLLIFPNKKIYAENSDFSPVGAQQAAENFKDFLTNEWLNQTPDAKYTRLGAENDLTKYAVRLNDSDASETIVFVDGRINLPVRQEFYSVSGERRTLNYTVEMKNFKTQTDENLFAIPKDYKRVALEDLKTTMQKEGFDEE